MSAETEELEGVKVMPPHDWARYRRMVLMPGVEQERSGDLNSARPNIQAAVTEYAIRELYARVAALEERLPRDEVSAETEARFQEKRRGK